jgi:hypothetical protein
MTDPQFFLFPTYLHQSSGSVIPEWQGALEECATDPTPGRVVISHYAIVASWLKISSLDKLRALEGLHIWSDEIVSERFHRWAEESVVAMMVRVYALRRPVVIDVLKEYAGCKSWITLAEQLSLAEVRPVLDDRVFEQRLAEMKAVVS